MTNYMTAAKSKASYTYVIQHANDKRNMAHITVWAMKPEAALDKVKRLIHPNVLVVGDWRGLG